LGESATCQSRITYTEMHVTQNEQAPCPAAHVVVMSQCEACGECQFKNVKCMTNKGISADSYDDLLYRKFEDVDVSADINVGHHRHSGLMKFAGLVGVALAALVAAGALRTHRSEQRTGLELPLVVGTDRYVAVSSLADERSPASNLGDEEA